MGLIPRRLRRNKNKTHVDTPSACSGVVHSLWFADNHRLIMKIFLFKILIITGLLLAIQECNSSANWQKIHPMADRLPPESAVNYQVNVSEHTKTRILNFLNPDSLYPEATIGTEKDSIFNHYGFNSPPLAAKQK